MVKLTNEQHAFIDTFATKNKKETYSQIRKLFENTEFYANLDKSNTEFLEEINRSLFEALYGYD